MNGEWINDTDFKKALWQSGSRDEALKNKMADPIVLKGAYCRMEARYGEGAALQDKMSELGFDTLLAVVPFLGEMGLSAVAARATDTALTAERAAQLATATRIVAGVELTANASLAISQTISSCKNKMAILSDEKSCQKVSGHMKSLYYKKLEADQCLLQVGVAIVTGGLTALNAHSLLSGLNNDLGRAYNEGQLRSAPHVYLEEQPPQMTADGSTTKIKSWIGQSRKDFFKPINAPAVVQSADVARQTQADETKLTEMGIVFSETDKITQLKANVDWFNQTTLQGGSDTGKVLHIDALPPPGYSKSSSANAFLHPEMAEYKKRLEKMGYDLVVDTSLPQTGAGAYQWERMGVVALSPDSTWREFIHEFQHAEFAHYLGDKEILHLKFSRLEGKTVAEALNPQTANALGAARVARLQRLLDKGLPELAINETLSVDAELNAMGFKRYIPGLGSGREKYALRHQITSLLEEKEHTPLSAAQSSALRAAQVRYASLIGLELTATVAPAAALETAFVYHESKSKAARSTPTIPNPQDDPNSYTQIVYSKDGEMLAQDENGQWHEFHK
jgi:hypothetical protein